MRTIAFLLACLACAGHIQRVHAASQPTEQQQSPKSLESLTNLLLANQPSAGWQVTGKPSKNLQPNAVAAHRAGVDHVRMGALRDAVLADGMYEETNMEFWDPLNLAGQVGDEALAWFRESEIKHGRVAMLASVGYLLGALGVTFPGKIGDGVSFTDVNAKGVFNAWSLVPEAGQLQIILTILLLEIYGEAQKPHYMRGGPLGDNPIFKGFFLGGSDSMERLKKAEMKHGRLAMFGIIGFLINHNLPGAVPFLDSRF